MSMFCSPYRAMMQGGNGVALIAQRVCMAAVAREGRCHRFAKMP